MNLTSLLTATSLAAITICGLKSLADSVDRVTPTLTAAVNYQENTIKTAEYLELSCAQPAREQWEDAGHKSHALAGIQELEDFSEGIKALFSQADTTSTNSASTLFN